MSLCLIVYSRAILCTKDFFKGFKDYNTTLRYYNDSTVSGNWKIFISYKFYIKKLSIKNCFYSKNIENCLH